MQQAEAFLQITECMINQFNLADLNRKVLNLPSSWASDDLKGHLAPHGRHRLRHRQNDDAADGFSGHPRRAAFPHDEESGQVRGSEGANCKGFEAFQGEFVHQIHQLYTNFIAQV